MVAAVPTVALVVADNVVNAPVPGVLAPILAASTVPPLISAVSATKESIFAVPSKCKSWNSKVEEPKSLDPSASGNISPPTVTPAPTRRAPPTVVIPEIATLPLAKTVAPTPDVPKFT